MRIARVEPLGEALEEAREAVQWYAIQSAVAADNFIDALARAIDSIVERPVAWPMVEPDARRCPVLGFPFGVIYSVEADVLYVVAIAHDKRRPGYWRDRR